MTVCYDCIVLGVGGFGSAALYQAAKRGLSVLGIEQFPIAHDRGSSHGEMRIIRKAYFEHPDYVPLLFRAYELWRQLEQEQSRTLMHLCGLMLAGPPAGETVAGAQLLARTYGVALEDIESPQSDPRFTGFRVPTDCAVVYEPEAGYLEVENCVRAHVAGAQHAGATVVEEQVLDWSVSGRTFRVRTARGEYESAALIVTAGPWSAALLAQLSLPLNVVRKPQFWFPVRSPEYAVDRGTPAFYFEMPYGHFYGFPSCDGQTLKAAEHSGGEPVANASDVDRMIHSEDLRALGRFLRECLPGLEPEPQRASVCLYTLTPDRHFIVDRHPEYAHAAFGAGFSGHGFKFTPVIGEALVDLAIDGRTRHPIQFLSTGREAIARAAKVTISHE